MKIFQVDAPTASKATLRSASAIAVNENWQVETGGVKGAFLQGNKKTIMDKTGSQVNNIVTENKRGNETGIDEVGSIFDEEELNIESWDQPIEDSQNPELVTDEI